MWIPLLRNLRPKTDLRGKVVVISGGARGIGADAGRQLYARGTQVALLDRDARVECTAAELGERALGISVDVTDLEGLEKAMATVVERFGGIDVVIANAGISGPNATVRSMDPTAFDQVVEINLLGVWRTVRAALPHVIERKGYVLAVASIAAAIPTPTMAAYGASKAGVSAFGHALRLELAHTGTQVGVAYFGIVDTDLVAGIKAHPGMMDLLTELPGGIGNAASAHEAGAAIVGGVERRSSRVFTSKYAPPLLAAQGVLDRFDKGLTRSSLIRRTIELADMSPPQGGTGS